MRKDKPSMTARKVALNIVTLGAKEGMDRVLPPGSVESTAEMLITSGAVGANTVRFARSSRAKKAAPAEQYAKTSDVSNLINGFGAS